MYTIKVITWYKFSLRGTSLGIYAKHLECFSSLQENPSVHIYIVKKYLPQEILSH